MTFPFEEGSDVQKAEFLRAVRNELKARPEATTVGDLGEERVEELWRAILDREEDPTAGMGDLKRRPAVLLLDDGSRAELPELTVGEALELVRIAREDGLLIGGEIDPQRIKEVGFEGEED